MRSAAILANGGGSTATNASIDSLRRALIRAGIDRVLGVHCGYSGLYEPDLRDITEDVISRTDAGCVIGSRRVSPARAFPSAAGVRGYDYSLDADAVAHANVTLRRYEVELLIVIGGDGSLALAAALLDQIECDVIGFPNTIDNDVDTQTTFEGKRLALCPGFASAAGKVAKVVSAVRDVARSAERVMLVEAMGEQAGWLASATCVADPDFVLVPECFGQDSERQLLTALHAVYNARRQAVVVVAEGISVESTGVPVSGWTEFCPNRLGGAAVYLCDSLAKLDASHQAGLRSAESLEFRPHHTDYTPRLGAPCRYDLRLVDVLAERVEQAVRERTFGTMPTLARVTSIDALHVEQTQLVSLDEARARFRMPDGWYDSRLQLPGEDFRAFVQTICCEEVTLP